MQSIGHGTVQYMDNLCCRYVPQEEIARDRHLYKTIETLFNLMPFVEGIPTCVLNLIVFISIVLIVKQPHGTGISGSFKSNCKGNGLKLAFFYDAQ